MNNSTIIKLINIIKSDPYNANNFTQSELETIINYTSDKYYNTDEPIINDYTYDILIDFLNIKFPKSKILKNIGYKINSNSKNKVKLDYWLGSMNKIKSHTKYLDKWVIKYTGNYILSDKLDGISALVIYNNNKINMFTRGDGKYGLDISRLVKYLKLPILNNNIVLRGELIMEKNKFNTKWHKNKNPRNTIAGLVNSKKINPLLAYDSTFIVYELIKPVLKPEDQLIFAKNMGFNIVYYTIISQLDIIFLSNYYKQRRNESIFNIDGIIVTNNTLYERNNNGNPDYAFAYKDIIEEQIVETTVLDIKWNISKDGFIKPVLILKPVIITGILISKVSAFNAKYIIDNKLGKGAIIKLIRSGDVIPYIQKVIKGVDNIELPNKYEWKWTTSKVDIILVENNSTELLIKNIYYFFSVLKTKGLGLAIIKKLVNANFNSIKKILLINQSDLLKINGFKKKSSDNLIHSIKKAISSVPLHILMVASNKLGHGIGIEKIKLILSKYPTLLNIYNLWTKEQFINNIKNIEGFEMKTSILFVSNFKNFINFYNNIKKYIIIIYPDESNSTLYNNEYSNLNIAISGFRNKELEEFLIKSNAKIVNTINKNTNLLIVKDKNYNINPTSKVTKSLLLNIKIIIYNDICVY